MFQQSTPEARACRFGVFEVDLALAELRKRGVRIKLQQQPYRILVLLLEHPGQVVTREVIRKALWPDDTFVEFEQSISAAVAKLRLALGDSAENPRFIETVARHGYRFIAPLSGAAQAEPASRPKAEPIAKPEPIAKQGRTRRRQGQIGAASMAIAAGIGFTMFFSTRRAGPEGGEAELRSAPLTSDSGSEAGPSFSPDGTRVAFSWDGPNQDNFDIYVKPVAGGSALRLTQDPRPDLSPAWSPDGRHIALLRLSFDNTAEIVLISLVAGEPERRLGQVTAPYPDYRNLRMLAWAPDGRWLVVSDGRSSQASFGLYLLSVETGEKRGLTLPPAAYDDFDPAFSPDGTRLAFVRHSGRFAGDVYVLEVSQQIQPRGEPKRLTFDHRPTTSPVWTHDGRALLLTRYALQGRHSLWKITLAGSPRLEYLPIAADNVTALALSPRGDRLVYARQTKNSNLWAVELPRNDLANNATALSRCWNASTQQQLSPNFSPDGQRVAFQSTRSGWNEIWLADRDGSHLQQLTDLRGAVAGFPHWSPDGQKIVFHSRPQSYAKLLVLNLAKGSPTPLPYEAVDDFAPSWSHDGKWIYFGSRRTGDIQVWKVPATGGRPVQVTQGGGWAPLESPDGRWLFYAKSDHYLWRLPLSGGDEQPVMAEAVSAIGSAYAVGRHGIYFISQARPGVPQSLEYFRLADGRITTLVQIPHPVELGLAVSPDERTILYSQVDHVSSELMLVEQFR